MGTALEITPKEHIYYDMPDYLDSALKRAINYRLCKTIRSFVACLPDDIRAQVKIKKKPAPKPEIKGPSLSWVFYDELATPEQLRMAAEYYQQQRTKNA